VLVRSIDSAKIVAIIQLMCWRVINFLNTTAYLLCVQCSLLLGDIPNNNMLQSKKDKINTSCKARHIMNAKL